MPEHTPREPLAAADRRRTRRAPTAVGRVLRATSVAGWDAAFAVAVGALMLGMTGADLVAGRGESVLPPLLGVILGSSFLCSGGARLLARRSPGAALPLRNVARALGLLALAVGAVMVVGWFL